MFLVCGEALFDLIGDTAGTLDGDAMMFRAIAGGSPYNVAVGLARLERKVALATHLYDDALGRRLEAILKREGVDLSLVRRGAGATPVALVEIDSAGVPRYAFHGLREMQVHPQVPVALWSSIGAVHVGSVSIVSQGSSDELLDLVAGAGDRLVSFDPNVRLAVEPDTALWHARTDCFRRHADLIKVSVEDLAAIHGNGCDFGQIAREWLDDGARVVVLTRGKEGCVVFSPYYEPIELPADPVRVADTIGAGDTFMAALLCWLDEAGQARPDALHSLTRDQLRAMGEFAARAAARTCSRHGPNMPSRSELAP